MRIVAPALAVALAAAALAVPPARADAERGRVARLLRPFFVAPAAAAPECVLRWRGTPYWLRPGKRIVETVIAGWFGTDTAVKPDTILLGTSAVYWEGAEGTLTAIVLAFRSADVAAEAERVLRERHGETTAQRFARRGTFVLILAVPPPANAACADRLWALLGERLAALPAE